MNFKPRHYHYTRSDSEPEGIFQRDDSLEDLLWRRDRPTLPASILRLAQAEYEQQHHGQDYERMQERGGLGLLEIVRLLADYVERLGGKPTTPRQTAS